MRYIGVTAALLALPLPFIAIAIYNNGNGSGYVLQGDLDMSGKYAYIYNVLCKKMQGLSVPCVAGCRT